MRSQLLPASTHASRIAAGSLEPERHGVPPMTSGSSVTNGGCALFMRLLCNWVLRQRNNCSGDQCLHWVEPLGRPAIGQHSRIERAAQAQNWPDFDRLTALTARRDRYGWFVGRRQSATHAGAGFAGLSPIQLSTSTWNVKGAERVRFGPNAV